MAKNPTKAEFIGAMIGGLALGGLGTLVGYELSERCLYFFAEHVYPDLSSTFPFLLEVDSSLAAYSEGIQLIDKCLGACIGGFIGLTFGTGLGHGIAYFSEEMRKADDKSKRLSELTSEAYDILKNKKLF